MAEGDSVGRRPPRDPEETVRIRRWLRIADEMLRRGGARKGGDRETPGRPPPAERRPPAR